MTGTSGLNAFHKGALLLAAAALGACGTTGGPQRTAVIQPVAAPVAAPAVPVAAPVVQSASLWSHSPDSLFGDRRARGVGDILTVRIDIDDRAEMRASVATDRQAGESFGLSNFFGLGELWDELLPRDGDLDTAVDLNRSSNVDGSGQLRRGETLSLTLAAQVADVTPNGDLVIIGRQNVQVEGEARTLFVSGLVRREDISRRNVITLDKIANAQVGYDGSGAVARTTVDRSGTRALDAIIPF
ncbi:MAG: flagellar basal body L-ring protein FlgH [Pseudomonadota bacterium]